MRYAGQVSTPDSNDEIVWMTTQEAARRMGVTPRTLYRFIDDGGIPAYKMGRVFRVKKSDVDAYIESVAIKPGSLSHLLAERVNSSASESKDT